MKGPVERSFRRLRALLILVVIPTAGSQPALVAQTFGEVMEVQVINVETRVTDRQGRAVSDLRREDFELSVDGQPVEITHFLVVAPAPAASPSPPTDPPSDPSAASAGEATPAPAVEAAAPVSLVIYVDNVHLEPAHRAGALQAVREFVAKELRPGDAVMLAIADPGLRIVLPLTADRAAFDAAAAGLTAALSPGGGPERERRRAIDELLMVRESLLAANRSPCDQEISRPAMAYAESARAETESSIQTLTVLVNSLAGIPGRKALLHLSDGLPLTPGTDLFQLLYDICGGGGAAAGVPGLHDTQSSGNLEEYRAGQAALDAQQFSLAADFQRLARHANTQGVTLFALQASGLGVATAASAELDSSERFLALPSFGMAHADNLRQSLTLLSAETGGRAVLDANRLAPELARIRGDLDRYYLLGFAPVGGALDRDHVIEVRVLRPGTVVRHRRGYRDKSLGERTVDRLFVALFHGQADNPLAARIETGAPEKLGDGTLKVPVRLRIPAISMALLPQDAQGRIGDLRAFVVTADDEGGTSPVRTFTIPLPVPSADLAAAMARTFSYEFNMVMKPGNYRLALALLDGNGVATSYLRQDVRIAPVAAAP